jgi:RND family efflux transporter MFP subunit
MQATQDSKSSPTHSGRKLWLIPAILAILATAAAAAYLAKSPSAATTHGTDEPRFPDITTETHVEVVKPRKGLLERKTSQAGTVMAFEWVDIYAEVSGYLKTRKVDIGSIVKKDDILAEIDVPELRARLEQATAAQGLAKAQVQQKDAAIRSAKAELKGVQAKIKATEAKLKSDRAYLVFRERQAERFRELLKERSIDARLVDEQEDRREAAFESVNASIEAVNSAKAQEEAATAKISQAEADLEEANQKVKVTKAEQDHAQAMLDFATIRAKFDGVISFRNDGLNPGAFIRAAQSNSSTTPLLTLQHTETMRLVVPIPDRDVPYCAPGAPASVVFDALPNEKFTYTVSRIAASEDLQTKTMRCEIDIPNTKTDPSKGLIRQGMYGLVTITLKRIENAISIPSACLAGKAEAGKAAVYVVRDGKAHLVTIKTGLDNGVVLEVLEGLKPDDDVVLNPSGDLSDGLPVSATETEKKKTPAGH